jgi:Flp pilus assembly protein TadG
MMAARPVIHALRRLRRDRRGATIVEFAMVAPVALGFICMTLELGYRAYLGAIVQGALLDAARAASVGDKTGSQIDELVRTRISALTLPQNVREITKQPFFNFTNVDKAEKLTTDQNNNGVYDAGDCYQDTDGNRHYTASIPAGLGTADDIVRYTVVVRYPNIFPVMGLLGAGAEQTITASTVLRNQPFTSRPTPEVRCDV